MRPTVLFLDFDGVLNHVTPTGYHPPHPGLLPECVAEVQALAEELDADVVVSSSWRETYSIPRLRDFLCAAGGAALADRLIDVTPIYEKVPKRLMLRSTEIAAWMLEKGAGKPHVILDDSGKHGFPSLHFVHIDGRRGFTGVDRATGVRLYKEQQR